MQRRSFAVGLAAATLWIPHAHAAVEPVDGRDYRTRASPAPVAVPGKVEVIEFFGYWCPHCAALEPRVEPWARQLPADVNFRRIPVAWTPAHEPYQRLMFALEILGFGPEIHRKVFDAVHQRGFKFENEAAVTAFASAQGIDKVKLQDAMKGFAASSKVRAANQAWATYGLDGVPAFVVGGRYIVTLDQVGSEDRLLPIVDALIRKARAAR